MSKSYPISDYSKFFREKNEEEKEKILQEIRTTHNPFYLAKFEEIVKKNGGHFVDGQVSNFLNGN